MEQDEKKELERHTAGNSIVIGLIDGLTVPFAIAAGLTAVINSSSTIFTACISITVAYSIFMGASAYISGKKYGPAAGNISAAIIICISYICGGLITALPYLFFLIPLKGFEISAIITTCCLMAAGYFESKLHHANLFLGAARTAFIALVAGAAAYGIAVLFR